jgi:transketolase
MTVIVPADAAEAADWVPIIAQYEGPVYLRISRAGALPIHKPGSPLQIGKARTLREGSDLTIVAMGSITGRSLAAAEILAAEGIQARLLEMHSLKPLDCDILFQAATETGAIVTAEEHNIIGGLGSAVAEVLGDQLPTPLERVGIRDFFCPTGRDLDKLMDACGLSVQAIVDASQKVLTRKKK